MSIPHELAAACADVRLATTADVIAGRQARWVAAPGTTCKAAAVLQTAAVLGLSVVPRGSRGRLVQGSSMLRSRPGHGLRR